MSEKGMGSSVLRKEDFRFITGRGKYTDDINHSNQLHAYFLRSPVAHANLISVDIESAKSSPGVVAIYTSKDIDASLPCGWEAPTKPGTPPMHEPPWPVFANAKIWRCTSLHHTNLYHAQDFIHSHLPSTHHPPYCTPVSS